MRQCWSEGALRAYLDRELPPEDMERAAAHLGECPQCEARRAELAGRAARVSGFMNVLPEPGPATSLPLIARQPRTAWQWTAAAMALAADRPIGGMRSDGCPDGGADPRQMCDERRGMEIGL